MLAEGASPGSGLSLALELEPPMPPNLVVTGVVDRVFRTWGQNDQNTSLRETGSFKIIENIPKDHKHVLGSPHNRQNRSYPTGIPTVDSDGKSSPEVSSNQGVVLALFGVSTQSSGFSYR